MPDLGKKYTCYSCHTKFYDLGKAEPICPKCGSDQRDAEEAPVATSHRGRRTVEEPVEESDFSESEVPVTVSEDDEEIIPDTPEPEEDEDEDDEEEDY